MTLKKDGTGYCVVQMNSTSGKWIVEKTTHSQLQQSCANINGVFPNKRDAERHCKLLNQQENGQWTQ